MVLFNRSPVAANITVSFSELAARGMFAGSRAAVRDLWAGRDVGVVDGAFTARVASHGVVHVNLTPAQ